MDPTSLISSTNVAFATVDTSAPKRRAGRKKFRETRHPVYKGVRRRNGDRWVCEVREPRKQTRIWLGTFPTPEMAARAHDVAAMALRGRNACLNFADSAWALPVPASSSARDIQKAAAEAAEAFRPSAESGDAFDGSTLSSEDSSSSPPLPTPTPTPTLSPGLFWEEEGDYGMAMPGLIASLAEGLLIPPPELEAGFWNWDNVECNTDMSLWSFTFPLG